MTVDVARLSPARRPLDRAIFVKLLILLDRKGRAMRQRFAKWQRIARASDSTFKIIICFQ